MAEPETKTREVDLGEAIDMAIFFQKTNQLAEADEVYQKILEVAPDHPHVLHYAGVLAHQHGRTDEGIALIRRSLEHVHDRADWYSNLGILLKAQGRVEEAIEAYDRAIALDPQHANAHNNLGVLLKVQGKVEQAEAAYRTAIRLNPEHVDAYNNLGMLLESQRRTKEAIVCYCHVTTMFPRHPRVRPMLANAYCTLGQREKAAQVIEEWLEQDPGNPVAEHLLAATSSRNVPARASDAYVERTFDGFAASFEVKLAMLSYRAPTLIAAVLADSGVEPSKSLGVLDAGCGTGLCGPLVVPYARTLTGVDLSGGMLDHAREKHVYDELVKGELTEYLRGRPGAFDLIVSADTLVYFGPLEAFVSAAAGALREGGQVIFTLEEAQENEASEGFELRHSGRYCHRSDYVERVLGRAGLLPTIVRAELRMESGAPVAGLVVRAIRAAAEPQDTNGGRHG